MSNWASVVVTWSGIGDHDTNPERDRDSTVYCREYTLMLTKVAQELGTSGYVDVIAWACGHGGEHMCCENVARLVINHLVVKDIPRAFREHAPDMLHSDQELHIWYKTEDMERYKDIQ